MVRKPKVKKAKRPITKKGTAHSKLDPRLSLLLSLPISQLKKLREEELLRLRTLEEHDQYPQPSRTRTRDDTRKSEKNKSGQNDKSFAPITTGVFIPEVKGDPNPAKLKEPYISALILSEASDTDLLNLGVKVRSQAGSVFSVFIPLRLIPKLERLPAIQYIELARPLFSTLNQAIPLTQINTLQNAVPPINGTGVIVGVVDNVLDFYHPDLRTAGGATRVLFLWDQTLVPQGGESSPPTGPTLPGFTPTGGISYGVEYNQANITTELNNFNPPTVPAYQTVRHAVPTLPITVSKGHGTVVTGCAAGNGLGQGGTFVGAAPAASIIFVKNAGVLGTSLAADNTFVWDAFSYIFARASLLAQPCVVNMSASDNQGPHDGTTLGERFLDNLLLTPGRAITLSAGNSTGTGSHASGTVPMGGTINVVLNYNAPSVGNHNSDDVEIWYDGHDRFNITLTIPTIPTTVVGPVTPGTSNNTLLPSGVQVQITSVLNDPRNGDNLISIIMIVPAGQNLPTGGWNMGLNGTTVINGNFEAWVDRNNRSLSSWQAPFLQESQITLGVPSTGLRAITVGNHDKTSPTPNISGSSGKGPTRDGRIKPEIATVGTAITAPLPRNMNQSLPGQPLYTSANANGTSFSAPIVAGACALLFQCRGGPATWANLKQILEIIAGTTGLSIPSNSFGFGFLQMGTGCITPAPNVDVWMKDDSSDTGAEPFVGPVAWLCPDIEILDRNGNPVPNPTYDPVRRYNNIIRVTVRNRGTQSARNTEVYLYWGDPATNIPYPNEWKDTGIFTGGPPNFPNQSNKIVTPLLAPVGSPGDTVQQQFAWAPPAPGSNIRGDDHFCLMARLENESDPSQIGMGGWTAISARNNIALHNVHVQPDDPTDHDLDFYAIGSPDDDSLLVYKDLEQGDVYLNIPIRSLPWRDLNLINRLGRIRSTYGCDSLDDPLENVKLSLKGEEKIHSLTDIVGAENLSLQNGIARVLMGDKGQLFLPSVRLAEGIKMPVRITVSGAKSKGNKHFVHVAQLSGGQVIGGVSLELRRMNNGYS
jgi:hypothetical protein